jgi:transcription initiation factor TFIID subunit 1
MFRAPAYQHKMRSNDFIVIHTTEGKLFVRHVKTLFMVGQLMPKETVPKPKSKREIEFKRSRLKTLIYRILQRKGSVRIEEVQALMPLAHNYVRKVLREFSTHYDQYRNPRTHATEYNVWVWKKKQELTERDFEICTPEHVCAYESMQAGKQRLRDMGYGQALDREDDNEEEDSDSEELKVGDEAKLAPWRLTENFVECVQGKCLLAVTGKGDPTGEAEAGFSYLRLANKPVNIRGKKEDKLMPALKTSKHRPEGKMSDEDKDLRKLTLKEARDKLANEYGYKMDYLNSIKRWQVVNLVRCVFSIILLHFSAPFFLPLYGCHG